MRHRLGQTEGSLQNGLGLYLVSDIDQTDFRTMSQQHSFHHSNVVVGQAKVG